MLLRPRQSQFVERCLAALDTRKNTLGVAPTGFGKTIVLSAVAGGLIKRKAQKIIILQHRDELVAQNAKKFLKVNPGVPISIYDAASKSWHGRAVFAMTPTLCRPDNLDAMPPIDALVIDEAHHAIAPSNRRIIDAVRQKNPDAMLFGVTATPMRGDKKGLRPVFDNVADQVRLAELIQSGHLVPPRTFVIDVGTQEALKGVRKTAVDFDMEQVAAIMDRPVITGAVVSHWKEMAGDRKTVAFCSTVEHARHVTEAFQAAGVDAVLIHGDLSTAERKAALERYQKGTAKVAVNVAVLTEGWDHPPTSCVVLLRPSSYKSTMIQMIGRGLRIVDPQEFPGQSKSDCIVLDFGTSSIIHGSLEQDVDLDGQERSGEAPTKDCPECGASVPLSARECSLCGYEWPPRMEAVGGEAPVPLDKFGLTEIDLLARSNFKWIDLYDDEASFMAAGFDAWAGIFLTDRWHAIGGAGRDVRLLAIGPKPVCLSAANDWLNEHETESGAHKTRRWLTEPASEKQLALLGGGIELTKYRASCLLSFRFNKRVIQKLVEEA